MVLMALDHARYYMTSFRFNPLDLRYTTIPLFLTRWVTHLCAPVFVFLAGCGVAISRLRGKPAGQIARFLIIRGFFLIILELTLVHFGWFWNFSYNMIFFQIIWVIGISMIILAPFVFFRPSIALVIGLLIIALHHLLDGISAGKLGSWELVWYFLHEIGIKTIAKNTKFYILYPLLPWLGVMLAGYGFGGVFLMEEKKRKRILLFTGLGLLAVFLILRLPNIYGDPKPWAAQKNAIFTFFSLINFNKYPPSLLFILITLGPAMLMLAWWDKARKPGPLVTFGRVPLFYYILHLPIIHIGFLIFSFFEYGTKGLSFTRLPMPNVPWGFGLTVPGVLAYWLIFVLILYFPCRWYAAFKKRSSAVWTKYL